MEWEHGSAGSTGTFPKCYIVHLGDVMIPIDGRLLGVGVDRRNTVRTGTLKEKYE
jgi:hypothetical protein